MKALVVDDELTTRLVLEDVLSRFGQVDCGANGIEAVRAARLALAVGQPYDLICMDVMMPLMNGLEALQLIRQEEACRGQSRGSRVVVITGSEKSSNIEEAFGQLCDAYIVKPVDARRFLDILVCLCDVDSSVA